MAEPLYPIIEHISFSLHINRRIFPAENAPLRSFFNIKRETLRALLPEAPLLQNSMIVLFLFIVNYYFTNKIAHKH